MKTRFLDASLCGGDGTGRGVRVAVIDSGWDRTLTDKRVVRGIAVLPNQRNGALVFSEDDHDRLGHGTICGRLILDVALDCEIVPIRVFENSLETSPLALAKAIYWATENRVRVINLSLGTWRSDAIRTLYVACERARRRKIVVVAADPGVDRMSYPASFDPVVGVGGSAQAKGKIVEYTHGAAIECAAEASVAGHGLGGVMKPVMGVSYAAPIVSGLIARWIEVDPCLDIDLIRDKMLAVGETSIPTLRKK